MTKSKLITVAALAAIIATSSAYADDVNPETLPSMPKTTIGSEELVIAFKGAAQVTMPKTTIGAGYDSIGGKGGAALMLAVRGDESLISSTAQLHGEIGGNYQDIGYKIIPALGEGTYIGIGHMSAEGTYNHNDFKNSGTYGKLGFEHKLDMLNLDVGYKFGGIDGFSASAAYDFMLDPQTQSGLKIGFEHIKDDGTKNTRDLNRVAVYFTVTF